MLYRSTLLPIAFVVSLAVSSTAANAGENCTCRGNGQDIAEGETVCLKTASGMKVARCERVLNNTSWKMLEDECPLAQLPQSRALPGPVSG